MFNQYDGITSPSASMVNILESIGFIIVVCLVDFFICAFWEMKVVVVVGGSVSDV